MTRLADSHPWLDGRFPAVDTLSSVERIWTFLAGNAGAGHLEGVARDWQHLPPEARLAGAEVILQTHLFAGYPRTINALRVVHELGAVPIADLEVEPALCTEPAAARARWRAEGESLCHSIYGGAYDKLRAKIASLHPDFDRWMVEVGYGRVLSRPGLSPRCRELCVVAILAGMNTEPQLISHLHGTLNVGASVDECEAVLRHTELIWGRTAFEHAWAVWMRVKGKLPRN